MPCVLIIPRQKWLCDYIWGSLCQLSKKMSKLEMKQLKAKSSLAAVSPCRHHSWAPKPREKSAKQGDFKSMYIKSRSLFPAGLGHFLTNCGMNLCELQHPSCFSCGEASWLSPPCTVALPCVQAVGSQPVPSGARTTADTHGHILLHIFYFQEV